MLWNTSKQWNMTLITAKKCNAFEHRPIIKKYFKRQGAGSKVLIGFVSWCWLAEFEECFTDVFTHDRVVVLDKVTDFILFLGKLIIVGLVGKFPNLDWLYNTELNIRFKYYWQSWTTFWWNTSSGFLTPLFFPGIFAFFFFSGHTDAFKGAAPSLHYYWVPILVSDRVWL